MSFVSVNVRKKYWLLISAFAAVYIIWGSTYLAIRFAIETIPPFLMAGSRFLIAGAMLYFYARLNGAPRPSAKHIKSTSMIGILLLVGGNGGVVWAEQLIPSGITALIITIEPLWVVLILWFTKEGKTPSWHVWLGILMGITGIIILIGMQDLSNVRNINITGFIVLQCATLSWALGSVYSSKADLPSSSIMTTGLQMFIGGLVLVAISFFSREFQSFNIDEITLSSLFAVIYLIFFGSIIGYTAYSWLTREVSPGKLSTYAYVNPAIAVLLGAWLGHEPLTANILIAAPILITAVALLIYDGSAGKHKK
jgi:drug/metabolite transporter (DMT)-like permease